MVELQELLAGLGYDRSLHYRQRLSQFEPETAHLFRSAREAGVDGVYVVQASASEAPPQLPSRLAVYVAEAETDAQARAIHRSLWNLGSAPFLLIVLPNQIKVYTTFDYEPPSDIPGLWASPERGLLHTLDAPTNIAAQLAHFSAEAIDTGLIWESDDYLRHVNPERRVDKRLLQNLSRLDQALQQDGRLESGVAHALIGKYVYIRYLRDRSILSDEWLVEQNIDWESVVGREATVTGLSRLVNALERRFNGTIFPVNLAGNQAPRDGDVRLVAAVFLGDQIVAQSASGPIRQLHLAFQAYQFDYIPIETLSSVYEQFIDERKLKGAFYTPEVLADYLLSGMDAVKRLTPTMKVLDPACGSGIFLVLALRRLIEQHMAGNEGHVGLTTLTAFLANMYGVERELDACYVTEFSLILTILHYIDPPELHRHPEFQFPTLHDTQIFKGDFFDTSLDLWNKEMRFDWIVGNPPWVPAQAPEQQVQGEQEPHEVSTEAQQEKAAVWIKENESAHPVGTRSVAEAFSWRVGDALAESGLVGLVMPAMSLVNLNSRRYRRAFFKDHEVFRITNFANFRRFLFGKRAEVPAATFVYAKAPKGRTKAHIVHYGPFSVNQIPHLKGSPWAIVINEDEIQTISPLEAERGETATWKLALWGTDHDRRALERLARLFPTALEKYCESQGWGAKIPQQGMELRADEGTKTDRAVRSDELAGTTSFSLQRYNAGPHFRFWLPASLLIPNDNYHIRRGSTALHINKAPHILISAGWDFVAYSDVDFIIPPQQMGISSAADSNASAMAGDELGSRQRRLKALCVYLNATIVRYYLFFQVPEQGFYRRRDTVVVTEVRNIPTPAFTDDQAVRLAAFYDQLQKDEREATGENGGALDALHQVQQQQIDNVIAEIYEVPDDLQILATDFFATRLRLDQDKVATASVTRAPSREEFVRYAEQLQSELEDFLVGEFRPRVHITWSRNLTECVVELLSNTNGGAGEQSIQEGDVSRARLLNSIGVGLRQQISQWVYIQRGLRLYDGSRIFLYKPTRLVSWTRTQAINDAADIIAQSIQGGDDW